MKKRLGKGLAALIDDVDNSNNFNEKEQSVSVPLEKINLTKYQVRKKFDKEPLEQLARSIKKNGLVQPIILRKNKNNYELIAGERRLKAAQIIKLDKISSIILHADDKRAFELGLIENLQREDLTAIEEANGYKRLIDEFNYTQEQLAKVVSKSRSHIANLLRIINLPEEVKKFILNGDISLGHARCLVGYNNAVTLAKKIIKEGLTVRYIEKFFEKQNKNNLNLEKNFEKKEKDADTSLLEKELSLKLGVKFSINDKNNKGNIKIEYRNIEQREKIIDKLKRN